MENAAIDIPDDRDFIYEELMSSGDLKEKLKFPKKDLTVWDQGSEHITRNSCTRYGLGHVINGQNILLYGKENLDLKAFWLRYLEENPNAENVGASLQGALQQALDEKIIGGYFKCTTVSGLNDALSRGYFIYTGSANGDWSHVRKNKEYKVRNDDKFVGHAFCLTDEEMLLNSYGVENGYSKISKDLYNTLYTKYAILPVEDYDLVLNYKKRIMNKINIPMAKVGFELGIWNGLDSEKAISREETVTIILRALEKFENREITGTKINKLLEELS